MCFNFKFNVKFMFEGDKIETFITFEEKVAC